MKNTYIIADSGFSSQAQKIAEKLDICVLPFEKHNDDASCHDWLNSLFKDNEINRLIIPLSLPTCDENTDGLLLGLHIRLSFELPLESRCIPIIFLSNLSIENIISKSSFDCESNPQYIIFSDGIVFSSTDTEEIQDCLNKTAPLKDYSTFLSNLNIKPKAKTGRHSVANLWGAFVLSKLTNNTVFEEDRFQDRIKSLYFKYVLAQHPNLLKPAELDSPIEPINNTDKKILLIDDEAYSCGWDKVFKGLFLDPSSQFDVICERTKDYKAFSQDAKDKIKSGDYDLFLLDLRMNGVDEEEVYETKKFSGFKILEEIKNQNRGNQVIVFTASNKAWNLKALLDKGANGYYIKESPEFGFSEKFSIANYRSLKKEIEDCLDNAYLKRIYKQKAKIDDLLNRGIFSRFLLPRDSEKYQGLIKNEVAACFNILNSNNENRTNHALIMLYKVVEYICKVFYDDRDNVIDGRFETEFFYSGEWYSKDATIPNRMIRNRPKPNIDDKDLFSTKNKCCNIIRYVSRAAVPEGLDQLYNRIGDLSQQRNDYIHGSQTQVVRPSQLVKWFEAVAITLGLI